MSTTSTPTRRPLSSNGGNALGDAWRVVVLNDDHNTFQGVAFALASVVPGVSYEQGLRIADRIHNDGLSVVWTGHKERAEHLWTQLREHGLTLAPLER